MEVPEMSLAMSGYVVQRELGRGGQGVMLLGMPTDGLVRWFWFENIHFGRCILVAIFYSFFQGIGTPGS